MNTTQDYEQAHEDSSTIKNGTLYRVLLVLSGLRPAYP
jgi:hypothetical protein